MYIFQLSLLIMTINIVNNGDIKKTIEEYIKKNKLRMTKQREIIIEEFLKSSKHVSSEELYAKVLAIDKSIGLATVYRMLKLLVFIGVAREENFGDGIKRYERIYEKEHHDHIICIGCGTMEEFEDETIEQLQEVIATKYGYTLVAHKMDLYGVCTKCKAK